MTRCYLKRSAKTVAALMVALLMVIAMVDTGNRYNSFVENVVDSSEPYPPGDTLKIRDDMVSRLQPVNRHREHLTEKNPLYNKTEQPTLSLLSSTFQSHELKGRRLDHPASHNEVDHTEDNRLVTMNDARQRIYEEMVEGSHTLRFWDLVNGSNSRGFLFGEGERQLPSLWRREKEPLISRDDDRVLAQLIWGMEATNLTMNGDRALKVKTIYLPDSFRWWSKTKWRSPHTLEPEDCPGNPGILKKCAFSQSRESMDALITVRDAFHTRDFSVPSHVLKFYFMLESPIFSHATLRRTNDLMATFYRGSDVNTPYGKWIYHDPSLRFKDQEKDYAKGKTKMAAIFTSNCHPWNNRMGYVRELQKYVEVDVFGACGRKNCPRYNQKECYDMLKRDYRFYLSFENSNCRDYVTEKLFMNAFENDVIPIVLGAHPQDYKTMCPEKSYIHVEDFPSPEELAKYMKHLAESPSEYNSYFRWKGTGKFVDTNFFCRVCAMVHYADIVPPPERHTDYAWNSEAAISNKICLPSGAWYWKRSTKASTPLLAGLTS